MAEEKNKPNAGNEESRKIRMNFGGTEIEATVDQEGRIIMPEEVQKIMAAGLSVMNKADKPVAASDGDGEQPPVKNDDMTNKFKGLPMRDLIGGPLFAAAEAQEKLASIAWDYYQKIAYDTDSNGKPTANTRVLKFNLNRPIVEDGVVGQIMKQSVEAPFIGLVPIPSLLIDRIDIDFQMEITDTNTSKSTSSTEATTDISAKWFGVSAQVTGKVSSSRENTRTTNQTAKYQVHVSASQQPQTEGLSKLMDIMAACIEPVPTTGGGGK